MWIRFLNNYTKKSQNNIAYNEICFKRNLEINHFQSTNRNKFISQYVKNFENFIIKDELNEIFQAKNEKKLMINIEYN